MPALGASAVSRLLLAHWDVLAVAESDVKPESEYLHEAAEVVWLLASGADGAGIADYLSSAAAGLGAPANAHRDRQAAEAIVSSFAE